MTNHQTRRISGGLAAGLTGLFLAACSHGGGITPELVDARRAYDEARLTSARTMAPDDLLGARQALEKAEEVHRDHPGSRAEIHYAYLAHRKAQIAVAHGRTAEADAAAAQAKDQYHHELEKSAQNATEQERAANAALAGKQQELSQTRRQLAAEQTASAQKDAALADKDAALEAERAETERLEHERDAALQSLAEFANVREDQRGIVITLSGAVLFKFNEATLLPIARDRLDQVAEALQDLEPGQAIVVEGHTDSRGSDTTNQRLSQARADSVRAYLVSRGVPAERITAVGHGEGQPVASNGDPEGRANNRRVEIVLSKPRSVPAAASR